MVNNSEKKKVAFIFVTVVLLSTLSVNNVVSTYDFYFATTAEKTLTTRIKEFNPVGGQRGGFQSVFFFLVVGEVWNSYPAPQSLITSDDCGLFLDIDYKPAGVILNEPPKVVPLSGRCGKVKTERVYKPGLEETAFYVGIRLNYYQGEEMPDGDYILTHTGNVTNPKKLATLYETVMEVRGGKIKQLILPKLPDNWGQVKSSIRTVPFDTSIFITLPLIAIFAVKRKER